MSRFFIIFLVLSFAFRVFFSLNVGLIDDEAYHWTWSQMLSLSYYDHPAMIAWLEYLSTSILGQTVFAIRLPAFICYSLTIYFAWKLAKELFGLVSAQVTVLLLLWSPFWGFGGYVASPEPPFMLCWILACWVFWQGVREDAERWSPKKTWLYLGLIMGLGLNSKFVIAMLAPGFGLYLLFKPQHRKLLLTRWPWIGFLVATVLCLPIFLWNLEYGWPGFIYQFHDRHSGDVFSLQRWLGWWAAQWGLMTPVVYFMMILVFIKAYRQRAQAHWGFVFYLALPSIAVFYPQPLFADYKPHWSGAAYLIICLAIGSLWEQGLSRKYKILIQPRSRWIAGTVIAIFVFFNILIYAPFTYPFMPKVYRTISSQEKWKTTYDLSNEFHGWKELGHFLTDKQKQTHWTTGSEPFLAALRYETTAQTWWGTGQRVFSLSNPRSHYTVRQEHHQSLEAFKGKNALVVTTEKYPANPMDESYFDRCTSEDFKYYRYDELSRIFTIWFCENFQGIKIIK